MSSSSCWYFQYSRTCGFRKYWIIIIIYCIFYGVVEWFKKYISPPKVTPKYISAYITCKVHLHVHGVGFEHYHGCLKETLQMVSEKFCMCTGFETYKLYEDYIQCNCEELKANLKQENWKVNCKQKWTSNLNSLFEISLYFPSREVPMMPLSFVFAWVILQCNTEKNWFEFSKMSLTRKV